MLAVEADSREWNEIEPPGITGLWGKGFAGPSGQKWDQVRGMAGARSVAVRPAFERSSPIADDCFVTLTSDHPSLR